MTRRLRPLLIAAALLAAGATPAAASGEGQGGMRTPRVLVQGYFGYHLFMQPGEQFAHQPVVGGRIGVDLTPRFGIEFGMGYVQTQTLRVEVDGEEGKLVHLVNPRLDFNFYFARGGRAIPYAQLGLGFKHFSIKNRDSSDTVMVAGEGGLPQPRNPDTDFEWDAALGLRLLPLEYFGFDLNARYLMSLAPDEPFVSADGSLSYPDRFDNLEFTVGVFGRLGRMPPKDRDGDGILDRDDECPDEPEDKDGFQDQDGCPDLDNDRDGIADVDDSCPDEPEDKDGFQDQDGCPDPDNDADGLVDAKDRCPDEPETRNGFEDADGCPDEVPPAVVQKTGVIRGIQFELDSDVLLPESFPVLDEAAAVLGEFPSVSIEIQGHASSDGGDEHNLDLSARRAEAVLLYLVQKGVDAGRLTARGYGETQPRFPDTDAERARNRRVEFQVLVGGGSVVFQP